MFFSRSSASVLGVLAAAAKATASHKIMSHLIWRRCKFTDASGYEHFKQKFRWDARTNMYVFGGVGLFGFGLYASGLQTIPYTNRMHSLLLSVEKEKAMGIESFQQVKASAAQQGILLPDSHVLVQKIRQIGMKIAAAAADGHGGGNFSHMKDLEWEFAVVNDPKTVNAFVVPGGKVVIFSGLLHHVIKNEDELAAVLAHEAAHVVARHTAEKVTELGVMLTLQIVISTLFALSLPMNLAELIISLPHSRRNETEADVIGLQLMARACFNPHAAASVLQKLEELESAEERIPNMLRTHPMSSERVERVVAELPASMELYHNSGCRRTVEQFTRQFVRH